MKQIMDEQSMERKSFENKMSHEYKLKKEMWKREMSDRETSKREREAILSQHKEQHRELEAANNQRLNRSQKETLDREVRKFRRRRLVKYHDLEQDLLREVSTSRTTCPLQIFRDENELVSLVTDRSINLTVESC